jgi:hypothetical protein
LIPDFQKPFSHQVQGLVPGGLTELTIFLYQGMFQSVTMVYKIKSKATFDTQMTEIGRCVIHPGDSDDPVADLFQIKLAPNPAVGTSGFGPFQFPGTGKPVCLFRQGPGGTISQAKTARYTAVIDGGNKRGGTSVSSLFHLIQIKGILHLVFRTPMDTSTAGDAFIGINGYERMFRLEGIFSLGPDRKFGYVHMIGVGIGTETTVQNILTAAGKTAGRLFPGLGLGYGGLHFLEVVFPFQ